MNSRSSPSMGEKRCSLNTSVRKKKREKKKRQLIQDSFLVSESFWLNHFTFGLKLLNSLRRRFAHLALRFFPLFFYVISFQARTTQRAVDVAPEQVTNRLCQMGWPPEERKELIRKVPATPKPPAATWFPQHQWVTILGIIITLTAGQRWNICEYLTPRPIRIFCWM